VNRYADGLRAKPVLAADQSPPDRQAVARILTLTDRLELLWLLVSAGLALLLVLVRD
jgi:adenosylcobinamide-phosphate synthase